jgi:hypothetical protein
MVLVSNQTKGLRRNGFIQVLGAVELDATSVR